MESTNHHSVVKWKAYQFRSFLKTWIYHLQGFGQIPFSLVLNDLKLSLLTSCLQGY